MDVLLVIEIVYKTAALEISAKLFQVCFCEYMRETPGHQRSSAWTPSSDQQLPQRPLPQPRISAPTRLRRTPFSRFDRPQKFIAQYGAFANGLSQPTSDAKHTRLEATRTLSLQTGTALDPQGNLQRGRAVFTKGNGLCDYTVKMPMMQEATESGNIDVTSFTVNDLTLDDRFKNKSYVVNKRHVRCYAGVPIRSSNGHSIGSYCSMDDKPRKDLSILELS
ncbi:uncharacterized protein BDZ99DRAFT_524100 [Mytilinidion resinicola]|uniref:GAF domain-containing protein n=1 Tax=Mytilinidion resinicola TaxID=574789 RepID=A0A6A6YDD7_9PEZI|nr:uncharacterized protein BDZ99DRAFT_524100 [Mytilinidion resinicola]KAF2805857.1 hypothetical protein BDZ99DRAFT_524100 [Mytilinidion resinicola]